MSIRGRSFTIPLEGAGVLTLAADQTTEASAKMSFFDGQPAETPATGSITLANATVSIGRNTTAEAAPLARALPLNGTAVVRISVSADVGPDACDSAAFLAEYNVEPVLPYIARFQHR